VHFSGCGSGTDGLTFEDDSGQTYLIPGDALGRLFELCSDTVKCVFLNACYSEAQADAIAKHIDYVVGMKKASGDETAIKFALGFYDALGAGKGYEKAFKSGCSAIDLMGIPEYLTPVLKKKSTLATASSPPSSAIPSDPSSDGLPGPESAVHSPSVPGSDTSTATDGDPGNSVSSVDPPPSGDGEAGRRIERFILRNPEHWLLLEHICRTQGHFADRTATDDKLSSVTGMPKTKIHTCFYTLRNLELIKLFYTEPLQFEVVRVVSDLFGWTRLSAKINEQGLRLLERLRYRRIVLDAICQSQGASSDSYVTDVTLSQITNMTLTDIYDCLRELSGSVLIEVQPTSSGVWARIEEKGREVLSLTAGFSPQYLIRSRDSAAHIG
jgi:hypothetical protein